jgi:serine/threonine-protein kinase
VRDIQAKLDPKRRQLSLELDLPPLVPKISKRKKVSVGSAFGGLKEKTSQLISTKPINVSKPEDSVRTKKRKVSRRVRRNRIIALLLLAGLIFGGYTFLGVGKISVPSLVGLTQSEAKSTLSKLGLETEVAEEVFSEDIEKGKVISSKPGGGGKVSPAGTVGLVISKGQERIQIPDLKGLTPDIASQKLSELGLTVGDINEVFDMQLASGFVVRSDPKNGEAVKRKSIVNIEVSKGIEKKSLISFVGKGGDEALSELTDQGFDVDVTYKFSDSIFKGLVISQTPDKSDSIELGSKIAVVVSKGPEFVFVPNVLGKNRNDASLDIENLGLKVVIKGAGKVNNISPAIGTKVKQGAVITLTLR